MLRSLALLAILASGPAEEPADLRDLAGVWAHDAGLQTILAQRSPHAAVAENVTITASSASEGRLDWGNGHEASWRRIVKIESAAAKGEAVLVVAPWEMESPKPEDLARVAIRLDRDASGRVRSITFADKVLVAAYGQPWTPIEEPVAVYLNRKILAGTYRDGQGRTWTFTPEGRAVWPDRTFTYEISIDASETDCDYIFHPQKGEVGETKRYGFHWQDGRLRIYAIAYPEDGAAPIHCDALMAELSPR
jgi:hypothetical protein